jgi:Tol biopolymer transport system component
VAIVVNHTYLVGQLAIHDLMSGETRLLPGVNSALAPRWSPDGQWIAFTDGYYSGKLMLVRPDGSGLHRLGQSMLTPGINWSPDSRWIVGRDVESSVLVEVASARTYMLPWPGQYPAWRP